MKKLSKRVMDMVRREFARNPGVKSSTLYEQAKKLDRSIASLSVRQFHARYPLQVKRTMKAGAGASRRKTRPARRAPVKKAVVKAGARVKKARKTSRRPAAKRAAPAAAAPAAVPPAAGVDRAAIRSVLLDFASKVASVENKAEMIGVIASLDGWVDRVSAAHG